MNPAPATDDAILRFADLAFGYTHVPAVHQLTGTVRRGALIALVGPNGAGKSTLLKGIMGQLRPLTGQIARGGLSLRQIAYMPQQAEIDRDFPISVFDMAGAGLWRSVGAARPFDRAAKCAILDGLAAVGLSGLEHRRIGTLSGGQFQRALFCRMLLQDAPLILLDEPFASIDTHTAADLLGLIPRWHGEGKTILAALHDMDQVRSHFPETLLLAGAPVAWGETRDVLTAANLTAAQHRCRVWDASGRGAAAFAAA